MDNAKTLSMPRYPDLFRIELVLKVSLNFSHYRRRNLSFDVEYFVSINLVEPVEDRRASLRQPCFDATRIDIPRQKDVVRRRRIAEARRDANNDQRRISRDLMCWSDDDAGSAFAISVVIFQNGPESGHNADRILMRSLGGGLRLKRIYILIVPRLRRTLLARQSKQFVIRHQLRWLARFLF
jgi:hypothetical protein